jgi:hypothetical protein
MNSATSEFEKQLSKVQNLCEEYNVPVRNLRKYEFVPDDLQEEHKKLKRLAEEDDDSHQLLGKEIARGISLDQDQIQKYYLWDIAVKRKNGIVEETYPEVLDNQDQNLIEVPINADFNKNGFEYKDHYLIFGNPIDSNFHLTTYLLNNNTSDLELKMLFSLDKLGLPETTGKMYLFEHWDGPKTLQRIKESNGIAHTSIHGGQTYGDGFYDKTEFLFEKRDDEWILHIEETLPIKGAFLDLGTSYRGRNVDYYTRYLHAITNEELTECYHLDGAIREYPSRDVFLERHRRQFSEDNIFKDLCSREKVFKLDSESGSIPDYQRIVGLFFKYNPYVIEFFDGPSDWTKELEQFRNGHFEVGFDVVDDI